MAIIHDTTMNPDTQVRGILATAEHEPGPRPGDH
jgi:hypothetical protein